MLANNDYVAVLNRVFLDDLTIDMGVISAAEIFEREVFKKLLVALHDGHLPQDFKCGYRCLSCVDRHHFLVEREVA